MFLRPNRRTKDGKDHSYWSLVETVRTPDGPRQKTLCYLGELNSSAQARWLKTIEVFNEQGETQQLELFPSVGHSGAFAEAQTRDRAAGIDQRTQGWTTIIGDEGARS